MKIKNSYELKQVIKILKDNINNPKDLEYFNSEYLNESLEIVYDYILTHSVEIDQYLRGIHEDL
jgi:hypothetical protein